MRGAARLAEALTEGWEEVLLFRDLATLRDEPPLFDSVDDIRWRGTRPEFDEVAVALGVPGLIERTSRLAASRA